MTQQPTIEQHRRFAVLLVLGLGLLLFLHFFRLGSLPAGFFFDESSIGYNAWSIALTGADEYGTSYPLFFRGFDNYHDPVVVYLLAPLLSVGGLESALVRSPSALFHVLAALAFALLVHEHVRNRTIALAAGLVLGVLPWGFVVSRSAMAGYTPMLCGVCLGWWAILRALRVESFRLAALSGLSFAFAMYAHHTGRPMTAVLVGCLVLSFHRDLVEKRRTTAVFFAVWIGALIPMAVAVMDSAALTERFSELAVWRDAPGAAVVLGRIVERYVEYFSPGFLFLDGDDNLRHHSGLRGELFLSLAPLVAVGLYRTIRRLRRHPESRLLLLALATYPLAASLTMSHMHSTRTLNGAPVWCLIAAVGLAFLWEWGPMARRGAVALGLVLLVESGFYLNDYFGAYAERSRPAFDAHLTESLKRACDRLADDETLYLSGSMFLQLTEGHTVNDQFRPFYYAHLLYFCKIPPTTYQRDGLPRAKVQPYVGRIDSSGLLLRTKYVLERSDGGWTAVLNSEPVPANARLLLETEDPKNVFQLWAVADGR